jgi:hypothetical protein
VQQDPTVAGHKLKNLEVLHRLGNDNAPGLDY